MKKTRVRPDIEIEIEINKSEEKKPISSLNFAMVKFSFNFNL